MSLQIHKDLPIVGKSTPKCVFQAKTPKGFVCVVADHMPSDNAVLHQKGFDVGLLQSVGELVE